MQRNHEFVTKTIKDLITDKTVINGVYVFVENRIKIDKISIRRYRFFSRGTT